MMSKHACPNCGSTRIAGPHGLSGGGLRILLPKVHSASLSAYVCSNCGYTEIYSDSMGLDNIRKYGKFEQLSSRSQQTGASCPLCGTPVRPEITACPECGYDLTQ